MNTGAVTDLLSAHADALNQGEWTASLLARRYGNGAGELVELFELARRIKEALVPLRAPSRYLDALNQDLLLQAGAWQGEARHSGGKKWLGAATIGSLLSLAGLLYWRRRQRKPQQMVEAPAT